ncbi:MAG: ABC transporter substrate-binding protein [Alphaproteobacteria bacterium]|nr:ABC transporter substrate-binding protein [Alphaproteobacteria bacterium]
MRALISCMLALAASAASAEPRHGLSTFGDLKYPPDFKHFEYVNPDAPKGGTVRMHDVRPFDTLNPYTLRGVAAPGVGVIDEALMAGSADEPDAAYGLVAEWADLAADRRSIVFKLRAIARWHDGKPITADDVVYSFAVLTTKGHPQYRLLYKDIAKVEALAPDRVRFEFKPDALLRDLPLLAGGMPILPKHYWEGREFDRTTLEPPLGSGPYRIDKVDQGRSIAYARVPDYWGRDLPVNRGRNNYDVIRFDIYRDRDVAFEAFKAGEYDFRGEFTARVWSTGYDFPAIKDGRVKRDSIPDRTPSGVQAWFFNLRRPKFQDIRVREAIAAAYDFEWANKTLFFGLYRRTYSMFQNSDMEAEGPPPPGELAMLEPFRGKIPDSAFGPAIRPLASDGSGQYREGLRRARDLLLEAGYKVVDGKLLDPQGKPFEIEFLNWEPSFERVNAPYIQNLGRLGIKVNQRIVDVPQYKSRTDAFDYDVITARFAMPLTPGIEQINYWHTSSADTPGSNNVTGLKNPAVDALIDRIIKAESRDELRTAAKSLDRVLMTLHLSVPQWNSGMNYIAFWDRFARPTVAPRYGVGFADSWWIDPAKDAALQRKGRGGG